MDEMVEHSLHEDEEPQEDEEGSLVINKDTKKHDMMKEISRRI